MVWVAILECAITALGVILVWRTLVHTQKAALAAVKAAEAAMITAEATRDALDRPWLWISSVENLFLQKGDRETQYARVHLKNYGKAPAIISSAKAILFYGPHRGLNKEFETAFGSIPKTMLPFPERGDLVRFVNEHARNGSNETLYPENVMRLGVLSPITFEDGVIVEEGESRSFVFKGHRTITLPPEDKGIPPEWAGNIFLIGFVVYSMPNENVEIINFCFDSTAHGGKFKRYGGPPYNETRHPERRKKQSDNRQPK